MLKNLFTITQLIKEETEFELKYFGHNISTLGTYIAMLSSLYLPEEHGISWTISKYILKDSVVVCVCECVSVHVCMYVSEVIPKDCPR